MGKGVLPNGPAAPSLENHLHGPALQRINARGRTVGTAAGASQYEPPVAARAPTLFYAGASCFSAFPAPREVAGPLLWEKGSCQMGPQRRVGKNTFMGPLYKEFMREVEPYRQVRVGSIHLPFVDLCAVPFTAELLLTCPLFWKTAQGSSRPLRSARSGSYARASPTTVSEELLNQKIGIMA